MVIAPGAAKLDSPLLPFPCPPLHLSLPPSSLSLSPSIPPSFLSPSLPPSLSSPPSLCPSLPPSSLPPSRLDCHIWCGNPASSVRYSGLETSSSQDRVDHTPLLRWPLRTHRGVYSLFNSNSAKENLCLNPLSPLYCQERICLKSNAIPHYYA